MRMIDNITDLLGDDFKTEIRSGSEVRTAKSTFSIFAFEALRKVLEIVPELEFLFVPPSFVIKKATGKVTVLTDGQKRNKVTNLFASSAECTARE